MKKKTSILLAVILVLTLLFGGSLIAGASEGDVYSKNIAAINERCAMLNDIMDGYAARDTSDGKTVAIRTSAVIMYYYNGISNLRADERISSVELSDDIYLLYLKGRSAGECAWIYEYHRSSLGDSEIAAVTADYETILRNIDKLTDISFLENEGDKYVAELSVSVYTAKIGMLYDSSDSTEVAVIAAGAIADIKKVADGAITDRTYEEIYQRAAAEIAVQRLRESARDSFADSYDSIFGEGAFAKNSSSDKNIASFLYAIKFSVTVSGFNLDIEKAISGVLGTAFEGCDGKYARALMEELITSVSEERERADGEGWILSPKEIFDGFEMSFASALTKDDLAEYALGAASANGIIDAILEEYNLEGGIFDLCADKNELELELGKARLRVDWAVYHASCGEMIRDIFGELDFSDATEKFGEIYAVWDTAVKDAATLEQSREALRDAVSAADKMLLDFEVEAFKTKYSEIIEKSADELAISDKPVLSSAISEFGGLGAAATERLSAEISDLALKYRAVCRLEIETLGNNEDSRGVMAKYIRLIDELEFSDADRFIVEAENILKKAKSAREVYALYEDIISSSEYADFKEGYKTSLEEKRDFYLSKVYSVDHTAEGVEAALGTVFASASLELCRCESEARIDALRTNTDSEAVESIISGAIASLKYADDVETMRETVSGAALDTYCERKRESLLSVRESYKDKLLSLIYLSESVKTEYINLTTVKYETAVAAIYRAQSKSDADIAYLGGEQSFDAIYADAAAQNITEAVKLHSEKIDGEREGAEKQVDTMIYLSSAEKTAFIADIRNRADKAKTELALMKDTAQIESLSLNYETAALSICEEAYGKNISNARKYRIGEAEKLFEQLCQKIDAFEYICAETAAEFKLSGQAHLDECGKLIEESGKLIEIDSIFEMYADKISKLATECEEAELTAAKELYTGKAGERLVELFGQIDKLSYLDDNLKARYKSDLNLVKASAIGKISGVSEIDELLTVWEDFAAEGDSIAKDAEVKNLSAAKLSAENSAREGRNKTVSALSALSYLSESEKKVFEERLESYLSTVLAKIVSASDVESVLSIAREAASEFDRLSAEADKTNLENARTEIVNRISEKFKSYSPDAYDKEKYDTIRDSYERAMARIAVESTINGFVVIMEDAYREMSSVISIFQATKSEVKQRLKAVYDELNALAHRYSDKAFGEVRDIYERTLGELDSISEAQGSDRLNELVDSRIALMRNIKTEWVSYGDINITSSGFADYPAGYDCNKNGPWTVVFGSNGIASDIKLSVSFKEISKHHKTALKNALRSSMISYVGDAPMSNEEIATALKDCDIKGVADIKLMRNNAIYNEFTGAYTVKILLPDDMRGIDGLSVMYISGDGSAEYYDAVRDGAFLVFETSHFSEFIIVGEKTVNLVPVIILLSVAAIFEGICAIIIRLFFDKASTAVFSVAMLPMGALSVVVPTGGVAIAVILGAVDIALGVYITLGVLEIVKKRRGSGAEDAPKTAEAIYDFGEDSHRDTHEVDDNEARESETAYTPHVLPALLDSVSAEEADELVSDSNIPSILIVSEENSGICRGCKKTFINVDTISDNFLPGDTVSIKELKEKRLIPNSACFLKVLARGVIDKPLTVKAQSFSANAVKMISLTGGTAILEGNSDGK